MDKHSLARAAHWLRAAIVEMFIPCEIVVLMMLQGIALWSIEKLTLLLTAVAMGSARWIRSLERRSRAARSDS